MIKSWGCKFKRIIRQEGKSCAYQVVHSLILRLVCLRIKSRPKMRRNPHDRYNSREQDLPYYITDQAFAQYAANNKTSFIICFLGQQWVWTNQCDNMQDKVLTVTFVPDLFIICLQEWTPNCRCNKAHQDFTAFRFVTDWKWEILTKYLVRLGSLVRDSSSS